MGYRMTAIPQKPHARLEQKEDICVFCAMQLPCNVAALIFHRWHFVVTSVLPPTDIQCSHFEQPLLLLDWECALFRMLSPLTVLVETRDEELGFMWGRKFCCQTGRLIKQGLFQGKATYLYSFQSSIITLQEAKNFCFCIYIMTGNAHQVFQTAIKNDHSRKTRLHFFACGVGEGWGKVGQGKRVYALTKLQVLTQAQIVGKETIYTFWVCTSVLNSTT